MNDAFYFIQKCDFANYAHDNPLSKVASTMEFLMECLIHDSEVAIHWFHNSFMEANPSKFPFMLLKSFTSKEDIPDHILINNTRIECESQEKLLGVIIDDKLKFNKHIDILCKNANKQINVLYRFRNGFNFEEREVIHNTFILANFNYCPIVWYFHDKDSIRKMEKTQERALRFLFNIKKSSYSSLLEQNRQITLHLTHIKRIACEVYKPLNKLNAAFMTDMFKERNISYDLRDSSVLTQPIFK